MRVRCSHPITKWNATVHDPRRMPDLARRAFREALSGRPGPVHLDIPQDVLAQACDFADDEFDLAPAQLSRRRGSACRARRMPIARGGAVALAHGGR